MDSNGYSRADGGDATVASLAGAAGQAGLGFAGGACAHMGDSNWTQYGGGGGGAGLHSDFREGGRGGCGVVILRYRPSFDENARLAIEAEDLTGGSFRRRRGFGIHTFAASGSFTLSQPTHLDMLIVAGGGGGGDGANLSPNPGVGGLGGGGAGGHGSPTSRGSDYTAGADGEPNTGGGGGGGGGFSWDGKSGGMGGSGIVIIRHRLTRKGLAVIVK